MDQVSTMSGSDRDAAARREYVMDIAAATAVGLRDAAINSNIRQTADFVNGMTLTGLLVEKNIASVGADIATRFADVYLEKADTFRRIVENGAFAKAEETIAVMSKHRIGVADQTPSEMLVTLGLAGEDVVEDLAEERDLTKTECLEIVSFAIVLAVVAGTEPDFRDEVLDGVAGSIEAKVRHWDAMLPSDREMFEGWDDPDGGEGEA